MSREQNKRTVQDVFLFSQLSLFLSFGNLKVLEEIEEVVQVLGRRYKESHVGRVIAKFVKGQFEDFGVG